MDVKDKSIDYFQQKIIKWYAKNGRTFPWRDHNISNYEKIIAEVLLQRTKAETIANFYPVFIKNYPFYCATDTICGNQASKVVCPP